MSNDPNDNSKNQSNISMVSSVDGSCNFPSMIAKWNIEKTYQEIKLLKEMKKKFKTTRIESLVFVDMMDPSIEYKFSDFYKYIENLGAGSFGFVVSAIDITTN